MKCPYRKVTYHHSYDDYMKPAYDEEGFAECYGKECPYYDEGICSRVYKKGGADCGASMRKGGAE